MAKLLGDALVLIGSIKWEIGLNLLLLLVNEFKNGALMTYIRGLSDRIQAMVRVRALQSLELAISYVLEKENFILNEFWF